MLDLQIAIAGTGAIGENLALSLCEAGVPIHSIISGNTQTAHHFAQQVDAQFFVSYGEELQSGIQLLFLCVPDDVIERASEQLAMQSYDWSGVCVAHMSGALTAAALRSLAAQGAKTISFHPVQTFVRGERSSWSEIFIGIEGDDAGIEVGRQIAASLGSIPLVLNAEDKALYHASAVFASNFLVTLIGVASDILSQIDVSREDAIRLLGPLIQHTCRNIATLGPEKALTGPASRGDMQTIKRHAEALGKSLPDKYHIYLELTREAIALKLRENPNFKESADAMIRDIQRLSHK